MTNYYKLYITSSKGNTSKSKYKWSSEVRKEIRQINIEGRHDACTVPRAVPVVESAVALAILDAILDK